jgi:hypothetical protein
MKKVCHKSLMRWGAILGILLLFVGGANTVSASGAAPWRQNLVCDPAEQKFRGVEYCAATGGAIDVVVVDLTSPGVQFQSVMPDGLDRHGSLGECKDVNRSTKQLGGPGCDDPANRDFYPVMSLGQAVTLAQGRFSNVAVVINGDYGAKEPSEDQTKWRDHGPEGFTVVRGNRLDGRRMGDKDNNAENRPWLAVSATSPLRAEISQYSRGEDQGDKPDWVYTGVGGAPWMISQGIVQQDQITNCTAAANSCYAGASQTAVGISKDGRWLFLVADERKGQATLFELATMMSEWGAWNAIKFDGGGSTHLWLGGRTLTEDNSRQLSQYLAVIAERGTGIDEGGASAIDHASPTSAVFYDIVLPNETISLPFQLRNEGQATWAGPNYELLKVSGDLDSAPGSLPIPGEITPGGVVEWQISTEAPRTPGIRSLRYQMHHNGQPFGDKVTAYVIVLPKQLADAEQRIRDQIEQWRQQGEQEIEQLMEQLRQAIQAELERQAQNAIEQFITNCTGSSALLGLGVIAIFLRRRRP